MTSAPTPGRTRPSRRTPLGGARPIYHAMASLGGDQVLLFGGEDAAGLDGETWVYDLSANTWTEKALSGGPSARKWHAMAYLGEDRALLSWRVGCQRP